METTAYLDRMLEPVSHCFSRDVAQRLVGLQADPLLQARIDELAGRCTEGSLSPEERAEYETYVQAGSLIAILQAKARKLLASPDGYR